MQSQYHSPQSVFGAATDRSFERVFALVSGGSDSTTAAHIARASEQIDVDGIIYLDTGVGIPQSRQWVREWADKMGLTCHIVGSQYRLEKEEYHNLVYNFGMPGPAVHNQMFRNLKQKPLQRFLSDVVDGEPLLISGVREHESQRRMENIDGKGIQEDDLGIWASPIVSFTDAEVAEYQDEHQIQKNPVNEKLHVSGDCLCGAFARSREELREVKLFFLEVFRYFEWLESHTVEAARRGRFPKKYALWGHGNAGTAGYEARLDDEQTGFNLCANCEQSCERSYDLEGTSLTDAEANLKQDHNEGYLESHYAQQATATGPLPKDDGRKPGDQQAWTPEHRHALTAHVDERARDVVEGRKAVREDAEPQEQQRARYRAIRATRDRALVYLLAYTAVRVGELLRDPDDPRRRGARWEDLNFEDGSMDVYRKKQQWDAASLPDPVIIPLKRYRKELNPPTERWPVFPTFDQRSLGELVQEALTERGLRPAAIDDRRDEHVRDLLLALDEDIRPQSITTDGARSILRRLTDDAGIEIDHPKHNYLAPHGGRRGMGEVLVRAFGYTVAARYLDNSEEMVRERYSHIEAGELGDVATEALDEIDGDTTQS